MMGDVVAKHLIKELVLKTNPHPNLKRHWLPIVSCSTPAWGILDGRVLDGRFTRWSGMFRAESRAAAQDESGYPS